MRHLLGLLAVAGLAMTAHAQPPAPSVAERAEFYRRIAALESTAELGRLARETVAATDAARRSRLEVILDRCFELDPQAAVRLAGDLLPDSTGFLGPLYERLARADVNAALGAVSELDRLDEARIASLAVLRGLGSDERAFELVTVSLQGEAREQFRADALLQIAGQSPRRALEEALASADPERRASLASAVVSRWANDAPRDALAAVERVQDAELRGRLRSLVVRGWRDPYALAGYLTALEPAAFGEAVASGALDALARSEPRLAAELAVTLPPGEERTRLLWQAVNGYTQRDPEAAVAWVRTLEPAEPELLANAVRHVASREPLRAFDLAGSLEEPHRTQTYLAVINGATTNDAQWSPLADRVLRVDDEQTKSRLIMTVVDVWVNRRGNPSSALDWLLANEANVPTEAFERVAYSYARSDPSGAASFVDRVPSRIRAGWIVAVTAGYATADLPGATQFLERFRGEPAFDRGAVMLADRLAPSDPPAAARLLASVGTRAADGAAPEFAIARYWAESDPAAAAAWALALPPLQRGIAVPIVTGIWGSRAPAAVRQWALSLPPGEKRDMALNGAIRAAGAAPPDPTLLAAFSNDRARQGAIMNAILTAAQTDVAAARRLKDEHITDPRMREQAEQMIDSFARGTAPLPTGFPGQFGVNRFPGGAPPGAVPFGQSVTVIGPNGEPLSVGPYPAGPGRMPSPSTPPFIASPLGTYIGPIPAIPPAREPPTQSGEPPTAGDRQ